MEIRTDEDWKERVKAEDAQRDAESSASAAPQPAPELRREFDASRLPPADFSMLVQMFATQAMVALGMMPDPESGESAPQPALAKHFIDLLGVLEEKTRGNLASDEERLLTSWLHQLRMAFVEVSRSNQ